MKAISRIGFTTIIMAGLTAITGQTETYASESQVELRVPVRLGVSLHSRSSVYVNCRIFAPGKVNAPKGTGSIRVTGAASNRPRILRIVINRSAPSHRFMKGDSYQCDLATANVSFSRPASVMRVTGILQP